MRSSGKEYIVFVIDEIGQYVGSHQTKILDLQGLAENLKNLGEGKVWIIGTAQQTLTEDDPRATINSPELFKLKDRFPITVDLESSDIKEICYRRLLGKSSAGGTTLGSTVRSAWAGVCATTPGSWTQVTMMQASTARHSSTSIPFLPAHFDILLHLLGALAKSTGGIGLRSAIKVIQDILIEDSGGQSPVADREVGWLATTVTLYDSLDKDIRRAFPSVHQAVDKVRIRFPDDPLMQGVGKTIGILQILDNMPVTAQNVASLMHSLVDGPRWRSRSKQAVEALLKDQVVPLGENDGSLRFFSEKLNDVEQERAQVPLRAARSAAHLQRSPPRRIRSSAQRPPQRYPDGHLGGAAPVRRPDGIPRRRARDDPNRGRLRRSGGIRGRAHAAPRRIPPQIL